MTRTASLQRQLELDAFSLAQGAQYLCRDLSDEPIRLAFYGALERTLTRGEPEESAVIHAAIAALSDNGDEDAYLWLLSEIETESELQYVKEPDTHHERACVLFAIPVVFPAFNAPHGAIKAGGAFEELHDIIAEAGLIDTQARFRMLPHLFEPAELRGKSKTEILSLTRCLSRQLMQDPHAALGVDPGVFSEESILVDDLTPYAGVSLRYLVGIASTPDEFLSDIFGGEIGPPDDDNAEGEGFTSEGVFWEEAFCEALDRCTPSVVSALAAAEPDGFHDDLRYGLELLREQSLFEQLAPFHETASPLGARLSEVPMSDDGQTVCGVWVQLTDTSDQALAEVAWRQFNHEALESCIEKLEVVLGELGFGGSATSNPHSQGHPSYLLH